MFTTKEYTHEHSIPQADIDKLKRPIAEGAQVHTEIETLNEGLKDTVKHIAEEMGTCQVLSLTKQLR